MSRKQIKFEHGGDFQGKVGNQNDYITIAFDISNTLILIYFRKYKILTILSFEKKGSVNAYTL